MERLTAPLRFCLSAALVQSFVAAHSCIHDDVLAHPSLRVITGEQAYADGGRRLQATTYANIRIQPIFSNLASDSTMTPALVSFLQNQLVPAAVERWQSALSLQPVVGPLYARRQCQSTWTTVTPNLCKTYASVTPCADVGDGIVLNIPSSYFGADVIYASDGSTLSTLSAGAGLPNTDFAVFVTAQVTTLCTPGTLAYAVTCQRDSFDRPTWARINFCPRGLSTDPAAWNMQLKTAMHEVRWSGMDSGHGACDAAICSSTM